jgi:hypothetical protein
MQKQMITTKSNTPIMKGLERGQGLAIGPQTQEALRTIERFVLYHTRLYAWYILIKRHSHRLF